MDRDHAADLARMAQAAQDASWSDEDAAEPARTRLPGAGLVAGDVGPKGLVGARHAELSRAQRRSGGQVPPGAAVPGTGRLLLATMLGIALLALGAAAALGWLLA